MKLRTMLPALLALAATAAHAQDWEELGAGSAAPPGIFKAETFDSSLSTARSESRASLGAIDGAAPILTFLSEGADNIDAIWSVEWDGSAWVPARGTTDGRVYGALGMDFVHAAPLSGTDLGLSLAFTAAQPQSASTDAYVATWNAQAGWVGFGGALEPRGISQSTAFNTWVHEAACAVGPDAFPDVAWSQGNTDSRSIFVRSYDGSAWAGLDGSDTTPIAAGGSLTTFVHPAAGFRAARPVVAYTRVDNAIFETVMLQVFNVTANEWQELGGSASTGLGSGRRPQIAFQPGRTNFFLAHENRFNGKLTVMEWTGSAWVDRGDPLGPWGLARMAPFNDAVLSNPEPALANVALAVDQGNSPVVVFRAESPAGSGKHHIFASWRNRTSGEWEALGDADALFGGISKVTYIREGARGHYNPTVYVPADNRPIAAWTFDGTSTEEGPIVLLKRFDRSLGGFTPSRELAIDYVLGTVEPNPVLDDLVDWNTDSIVDAADVRRLTP